MEQRKKEKRDFKLLVGLPGSGKSTYIQENKDKYKDYTILCLDDFVEIRRAELERDTGQTLRTHDIWKREEEISKLRKIFDNALREAVKRGDNILIDGIHDKPENRAYILGIAKASDQYDYKSTAVVMHPPEEHDHIHRLVNRAFKDGRVTVLNHATLRSISPIKQDEFDQIECVGEPPRNPMFHEYHGPQQIDLVDIIKDKGRF